MSSDTNDDISWTKKLESQRIVAEFNKGYSHIAVDDHCYVLLNGGEPSHWLFKEALQVLRRLPENPDDAWKLVQQMKNTTIDCAQCGGRFVTAEPPPWDVYSAHCLHCGVELEIFHG